MKRSRALFRSLSPALVLSLAIAFPLASARGQESAGEQPAGATSAPPARVLIIRGARLLTMSGEDLERGEVWIEDGRIRAVGESFKAPEGAEVLDASGLTILPGMIDAASDLLLEASSRGGSSGSAGLRFRDAIDPFDREARRAALARGVTAVGLARTAKTSQLGLVSVVKLGAWKGSQPPLVATDSMVCLRLGLRSDGLSKQREAESLGKLFEAAAKYHESREKYARDLKAYEKKLAEWQKKQAKAKKSAKSTSSGSKAPRKPRKPAANPSMEALFGALAGERAVCIQVGDERDIENALELARRFGLRLVLRGLARCAGLEKRIAAAGVPCILEGPAILAPPVYAAEALYRADNAARLIQAGVAVCFATGSGGHTLTRHLLSLAAEAVARGVEPEAALRAVTSGAARALGLEKRLGSIAVGCDADLVAFRGDPLSSRSRVSWVMVEGRIVHRGEAP